MGHLTMFTDCRPRNVSKIPRRSFTKSAERSFRRLSTNLRNTRRNCKNSFERNWSSIRLGQTGHLTCMCIICKFKDKNIFSLQLFFNLVFFCATKNTIRKIQTWHCKIKKMKINKMTLRTLQYVEK